MGQVVYFLDFCFLDFRCSACVLLVTRKYMPLFQVLNYRDCLITTNTPLQEEDLAIKVEGVLDGHFKMPQIGFQSLGFTCEAAVVDHAFTVWLSRPGHYDVVYTILNNYTRLIAGVDIHESQKILLPFKAPSIQFRVRNLPCAGGGMVCLRTDEKRVCRRYVDSFESFVWDFQDEFDISFNSFQTIGLVMGGLEHRFPFYVRIGSTVNLDFTRALKQSFKNF